MRVRVFLRQPLFTLPDAPHVPASAYVLEGTLGGETQLGPTLQTEAYYDERGRPLPGKAATLVVPGAKIDHVLVLE